MSSQGREDFSSCCGSSSSSSILRPSRGRSSEEQQPSPHVDAREQQQCFLPQQQQRLQEPQACLSVVQPMTGEHTIYQREQPPGMAHEQEQQLLVRVLQLEEQQQSCYNSSSSCDHVRRTCFICLEGAKRNKRDHSKRRDLYSCCTQCYVVVHRNCWAAYRRRQQLATFRARLLGQRAPTPHLCSICKTGSAGVTGDPPLPRRGGGKRGSSTEAAAAAEGGGGAAAAGQRGRNSSVLQEQLLASLGRLLQNDDEDTDRPPLCTGVCMCINTGVLVAVLLVDLLLMAFTCIYPLQVLLVSLFLCYNAIVIQLLVLAIRQRREYMRMYMSAGSEGVDANDGSDASSSSGSSGGRRGSEESRVSSGAADYERNRRRSFEEGEYNPYTAEEEEEEEVEMEGGELFEEEGAAERGSSLETATRGLRSVFLAFSSSRPSGSSSAGRRRQGNSSSSGSHGGRRRSNSSSGSGAGRREAFLRVNDREAGSADSRIGELWTAAKRFYFSLLRDAWRWTERSASAVGEPLGGGGWREDTVLQEDLGSAAAITAGEYYRRAEAAVEAHLAADVEMQTLGLDVLHANSSAAPEPQHLRQVSVQSS